MNIPNLFIVGAAKAGTTSLYRYLQQHPDIFFPNVKEPNYYSRAESHNPSAYRPPKEGKFYHTKIIRDSECYFSLYNNATGYKVSADSSPSYLWDLESAKRIYSDSPNAKVIIMLRNPVKRAFSQFLMDLRDGRQQEEDFLKALKNDKSFNPKIWGKAHLYEEIGMYHNQVKRYIDLFGNNCKIIIYEKFINDLRNGLIEIFKFLEIDTNAIENINYDKIHNSYAKPKNALSKVILRYKNHTGVIKALLPSFIKAKLYQNILSTADPKPEMPVAAKKYLQSIYDEDIEKLKSLLNDRLEVWKR